jgi:hypothetical protein
MAYNIPTVQGDGSAGTNIVIADGTLDSTTLLDLPGRNYSGYGQPVDTNMVKMVQNFANSSVPSPASKLLAGQLWFNTSGANATSPGSMYIYSGFPNVWLKVVASDPNANTSTSTFQGTLEVTGNITANDSSFSNSVTVSNVLTVSNTINVLNINTTGSANFSGPTTNVSNLVTSNIAADSSGNGQLTGNWTITGNSTVTSDFTVGNSATVTSTLTAGNLATGGNLTVTGNSSVSGNSSISGNLTVTGNISAKGSTTQVQYNNTGNLAGAVGLTWNSGSSLLTIPNANVTTTLTTTNITTGAVGTAGTMTGNWTLSAGSRLNATYADLAERFAADDVYTPGTVVELGGAKEITLARLELSERVFGVVSDTAGQIMNAMAGDDNTHPAIAMSGRVKVKTRGRVSKGDRLVSAGNGVARAASTNEATSFNVIGRSLEDKQTEEIGHVLAAVGARVI